MILTLDRLGMLGSATRRRERVSREVDAEGVPVEKSATVEASGRLGICEAR